jgi:hypothetical protein
VGYIGQVPGAQFRQIPTSLLRGEAPAAPHSSREGDKSGDGAATDSRPTPEGGTQNLAGGCITLVARMAASRSGTRLWRKGLDLQVDLQTWLCGSRL